MSRLRQGYRPIAIPKTVFVGASPTPRLPWKSTRCCGMIGEMVGKRSCCHTKRTARNQTARRLDSFRRLERDHFVGGHCSTLVVAKDWVGNVLSAGEASRFAKLAKPLLLIEAPIPSNLLNSSRLCLTSKTAQADSKPLVFSKRGIREVGGCDQRRDVLLCRFVLEWKR